MRNILAACSFALLAACAGNAATDSTSGDIACQTDTQCATTAGGGTCADHVCRADNECTSDADCPSAERCVRSSVFGHGLCTPPDHVPEPDPIATCATAAECPVSSACGIDRHCHQRFCITDAQCPTGEACHPLCGLTSAAVGGVCEPGGVPIQQCPPPGGSGTPSVPPHP